MEYEVSGTLDFEGLEEAKKLLISPKQRRIEAGVDVMLTSQGLTPEQKRVKNCRRIQRMAEKKKGVKDTLEKMRKMNAEGYDNRQIGMSLIVPQMGKKVSAQKRKLSVKEKAKLRLKSNFLRRKTKAQAKAMGLPSKSVELPELEKVPDPEEQWKASQGHKISFFIFIFLFILGPLPT